MAFIQAAWYTSSLNQGQISFTVPCLNSSATEHSTRATTSRLCPIPNDAINLAEPLADQFGRTSYSFLPDTREPGLRFHWSLLLLCPPRQLSMATPRHWSPLPASPTMWREPSSIP